MMPKKTTPASPDIDKHRALSPKIIAKINSSFNSRQLSTGRGLQTSVTPTLGNENLFEMSGLIGISQKPLSPYSQLKPAKVEIKV